MGMGVKGRCRKLAELLGCQIHQRPRNYNWSPGFRMFDIYAPGNIYGWLPSHQPNRRESGLYHVACDKWEEVWEHLQAVRVDLFFHGHGIDVPTTKAILLACVGTGEELFAEWVGSGSCGVALVLADWLADQDHEGLGVAVRRGVSFVQTRRAARAEVES